MIEEAFVSRSPKSPEEQRPVQTILFWGSRTTSVLMFLHQTRVGCDTFQRSRGKLQQVCQSFYLGILNILSSDRFPAIFSLCITSETTNVGNHDS